MPYSYCSRYYELRQIWEQFEVRLNLQSQDPQKSEERNTALGRLRAHLEVCDDCVGAFFEAFPETQGKAYIMVDIIGLP